MKYNPRFEAVGMPSILWNLSNKCNMNCDYCYQNANNGHTKELPLSKKLELIDQFVDAGVGLIGFSGGEPLMETGLYKLIRYASRKGIYSSVLTNGTLLTNERAKKLREHGVEHVSINLDSANPSIHNSFRGKDDVWEKTLEGILNAMENGLKVRISATITQRNLSNVEELIQFGEYLMVDEIELINLLRLGRGKNIAKECLTKEQVKYLIETAIKYSNNKNHMTLDNKNFPMGIHSKSFIVLSDPQYYLCLRDHLKQEGNEERIKNLSLESSVGCAAGICGCAIQPDGKVTPCGFTSKLIAGDIKEQDFKDIWLHSDLFEKLRNVDNLKGNCGSCEDKSSCGGCRARAYSLTGDILGGDPLCIRK